MNETVRNAINIKLKQQMKVEPSKHVTWVWLRLFSK